MAQKRKVQLREEGSLSKVTQQAGSGVGTGTQVTGPLSAYSVSNQVPGLPWDGGAHLASALVAYLPYSVPS